MEENRHLSSNENKQATLLLMNLAISSIQNRIAKQLGIKPGQEMLQAIESAEEVSADLVLADRDMLNYMLKEPLIDERVQYLAQKIKESPGNKVVAIVGAAHVSGITKGIYREHSLKKLNELPPKATWLR